MSAARGDERTDRLCRELLDVLEQETGSLRRLREQASRTRAAVARRDLATLHAAVSASQAELSAQAGLEQRRRESVEALGAALGLGAEDLPLGRLAESLPPHHRPAMLAARRQLHAAATELADSNQQCEELLRSMLRLVAASIRFFLEVAGRGGYSADGRAGRVRAVAGALDFRA